MLTFFAVNRHGEDTLDLAVDLKGFGAAKLIDHQVMTHANLEATNARDKPDAVTPKKGSLAAIQDKTLTAKLAPYSYQMLRLNVHTG